MNHLLKENKLEWLKRLKCQHYYIEDGWTGLIMVKNIQWHCVDCGKIKLFYAWQPPINPRRETNQEYYNRMVMSGKAHLVMRPALGTEGEPKL